MPSVLVITGATASGKTEYALRLAEQLRVPIINADSRQIYRDLPIGTAAPTPEEQARVKHFLVGTHNLDQSYNAGMFERDALSIIRQLTAEQPMANSQQPIAIVCGGSMLYIDALCNGLDDIPEVPEAVRREVAEQYRTNGLEWLQAEVQRLDPDYWQTVDRQNPQRLLHCVELCRVTSGTYSSLRKQTKRQRPFEIKKHIITRTREELYERINARVIKMIEAGLLDEADRAFRLTLGDKYRAMTYEHAFNLLPNSLRTVGYQELLPYFLGTTSLESAIALIQQNTRRYAKRQLTWWRNK